MRRSDPMTYSPVHLVQFKTVMNNKRSRKTQITDLSQTQSNSGYCFDWAYNGDDYFVDAVGGIGHPVYFGMHLINHSRLHVNVTVTEDLYFSASRDICKGVLMNTRNRKSVF